MTGRTENHRISWTQLSVRVGYTRRRSQRGEILAGIEQMTWAPTTTCLPHLDGPAVRAIVTTVFHHRPNQLGLVGVARLNNGRQLIGLEDDLRTRRYLLDLDTEVISVLAEFGPSTQRRVA